MTVDLFSQVLQVHRKVFKKMKIVKESPISG
jgi:hypothetical protein